MFGEQEEALGTGRKQESSTDDSLPRLARRISSWTTKSLLTVMLLVIALGFGREVLHWWHDDDRSPAAMPIQPADLSGDRAAPHVMEFGDRHGSMRREAFSGPLSGLPAALEAACRAAIVAARPRSVAADAVERELLNRLAHERPVAEEQGQWRIYRWGEGQPVLIGTRAFPVAGAGGKERVGRKYSRSTG